MDEASEQVLTVLMDAVPTTPVLLLLTARPGLWHLPERTYASRLALEPLDEEESAGLVRGVLGASPPPELVRLVAGKAEGNPFYAEEVIRSFLETGVLVGRDGEWRLERPIDALAVPDTVQEVILARIDRLEKPAKEAIQQASVIGREFALRLLQRISDVETALDRVMGELKALELVHEKAYFPELAYIFNHALTHDVAYSTLLGERRRALHRLVAAAAEELYADRLPEQYEILAHHYYEGGGWEKAFEYLTRAGHKAAAAFANQQSLDFYARAIEVGERLGGDALQAVASLAARRGYLNFTIGRFADALVDMNTMLATARRLGDRGLEGVALSYRAVVEIYNHDHDTAEATLHELFRLAESGEGSDQARALASLWLGMLYTLNDRHEEAVPLMGYVAEHAADMDEPFAEGWWAWLSSRLQLWAGRLDAALQKAEEGRPVAQRIMFHRLWSEWNEAHVRATKGDYEGARRLLEATLATAERIGYVVVRVRCLNTLGYVYGELADVARAMPWNQEGLDLAIAINAPVPEVEMNARLNLVENLLAQGRLDEAEGHLRLVETVVRHPQPGQNWNRWRYGQRFLHDQGEYWLARGDPGRALSLAAECQAWAERSGSRKNVAKARRLAGLAHLVEGRLGEAEAELIAALAVAEEVGSPPQMWKAHAALAELRRAQKQPEAARAGYRGAVAVIDEVASRLTDEKLRVAFLASEEVHRIRQAAGAVSPVQ